jgi:hypothetical protein
MGDSDLADTIRQALQELNLADLARETPISRHTWQSYKIGRRTPGVMAAGFLWLYAGKKAEQWKRAAENLGNVFYWEIPFRENPIDFTKMFIDRDWDGLEERIAGLADARSRAPTKGAEEAGE